MKNIKNLLALGLLTLTGPLAHAALINFHFGAGTQTGGAALGATGDYWNANNLTNGTNLLKDSTGASTPVTVTWTSGVAGQATGPIWSSKAGTAMDAATTPLMIGYAASYAFTTGNTNLAVTIGGLANYSVYTLALYAAGDRVGQGTAFTVAGSTSVWPRTDAVNRLISDGIGNAYQVVTVRSSGTGTITINTRAGGFTYAVLNGFQLAHGTVTANTTMPVTTPAPIALWGVCGHPTQPDYASWLPANVTTQMNDLKAIGAKFYRVSFQGSTYPSYLDTVAPPAAAAGITLLPNLPVVFVPANNAQTNYNSNYSIGYAWASYAISKGYAMPYWELGNEPENNPNLTTLGDGSSPIDFPDKIPGGFVATAAGLQGAYDGIKQAYTDGRSSGTTTITPQCLIGMCYRHWGLLAKIQAYDGELPCDIISWHWYGPSYGDFSAPMSAPGQWDDYRAPYACLADFKSKTDPSKPMDVWITETNRTEKVNGVLYNGSTASLTAPTTTQDWASEATAIQGTCDSFKKCANVKAVFAYELYDETKEYAGDTKGLASFGYYGLITKLNGTRKPAFTTFQTEISSSK